MRDSDGNQVTTEWKVPGMENLEDVSFHNTFSVFISSLAFFYSFGRYGRFHGVKDLSTHAVPVINASFFDRSVTPLNHS